MSFIPGYRKIVDVFEIDDCNLVVLVDRNGNVTCEFGFRFCGFGRKI